MIKHSSHYSQQRIEDLKFCLRILPVLHQTLISEHMGTYKLTEVIKEKLDEDYQNDNISEMEIFLSTFLYIDLKGEKYTEALNRFISYFNKAYLKYQVIITLLMIMDLIRYCLMLYLICTFAYTNLKKITNI